MHSMPISKFKATCLAVLERFRTTGRPVLITKRGEPVARVLPPPPRTSERSAFGCMTDTAEKLEDIVEPLPEEDWEAVR